MCGYLTGGIEVKIPMTCFPVGKCDVTVAQVKGFGNRNNRPLRLSLPLPNKKSRTLTALYPSDPLSGHQSSRPPAFRLLPSPKSSQVDKIPRAAFWREAFELAILINA